MTSIPYKVPGVGTKIRHDSVENPKSVKGSIPDSPPGVSPASPKP